MDGRETDVLVLQEDKISYVLAGKNLLSDSAAGGAIASVPEVLGTQIARTEKYGISFNPESYVQWGYDRYFTDVKRGAVLQLVGNSYSNEQLKVVSEMNMRTWFRDRFNESFNTQKLGGFDPYMNEYVLVVNDKELPINVQCLDCGVSQTFTLSGSSTIKGPYTYCVNLGSIVGDVTISWNVLSISEGATFSILAEYNGGIYSPASTFDTFLTFNKNVVTATTCNIFIIYDGDITLSITADCPIPEPIKLVEIVLTSNSDAGDLLYTEYRYTSGSYISPLQSNLVTFASGTSNPLVSRYNITSGSAGFGSFPPAGSTMTLRTNKYGVADKDFNPLTNKFRYYRSSTLYNNNSIDLNTLLGLSVEATPITGGPIVYQADFTVPPSIEGENLYLIWDMRAAVQTQLCYTSGIGIDDPVRDVCCNCLDSCCVSVNIENVGISAGKVYLPNGYCSNNFGNIVYLNPGNSIDICAKIFPGEDLNYTILEGDLNVNVDIVKEDCSCETKCPYGCERWVYYNKSGFTNTISYIDCTTGEQLNLTVPGNQFAVFCTLIYSIPPSVLSGEFGGFFQQVSGCTDVCCEGEPCTEFIITAFSPISVQYNQCGVGNTTVSYGIGTYNICVTYPFLPQITGDSYSYELSLNCGCGGDVVVPIG
jgi:hypothetical protein